jgi:hypothetical protein
MPAPIQPGVFCTRRGGLKTPPLRWEFQVKSMKAFIPILMD